LDLILSSEQEQVIAAADAILRKEPQLTSYDYEIAAARRSLLAGLGWFGLAIGVDLGGAGLTCAEEMLVFREIGRSLGPTSVLPIALSAQLAAGAGSSLTRQLLQGSIGAALALAEGELNFDGEFAAGPVRLFDSDLASVALFCNERHAVLLDLAEQRSTPVACLDKSISMSSLRLERARVLARLQGPSIERLGKLLTAAMLVGISEATLAMIVEYAKLRRTFGRPIGSYQAVRHPCADMAVRCESARAQLFVAAASIRDGMADTALQVNAAKAVANAAAIANVDANIQLHGGIGITAEYSAHRYFKRACVLARWFGSDRSLLDAIIRQSTADFTNLK
jgi:alkylation response protein AidB-like acyl-CoA dehydrogenase